MKQLTESLTLDCFTDVSYLKPLSPYLLRTRNCTVYSHQDLLLYLTCLEHHLRPQNSHHCYQSSLLRMLCYFCVWIWTYHYFQIKHRHLLINYHLILTTTLNLYLAMNLLLCPQIVAIRWMSLPTSCLDHQPCSQSQPEYHYQFILFPFLSLRLHPQVTIWLLTFHHLHFIPGHHLLFNTIPNPTLFISLTRVLILLSNV